MRGGGGVRANVFRIDNTHHILRNKAYIAIKAYKTKDGTKESVAVWEKIVDPVKFDRVQNLLSENRNRKKPVSVSRYPYLLSGLLFCKTCGDRMCGKSAHGKKEKIAYYEHGWSTKNQSCLSKQVFNCEPTRILAKKIEPVVWGDVKRLLQSEAYAKLLFGEAKASYAGRDSGAKELDRLKAKIASIDGQIEATTERITELPKGIDAKPFYAQILKLQEHRTAFENQLGDLKSNQENREEPIRFTDFKAFTDGLKALIEKCADLNEQASIVRKLVERIDVKPDGIVISYHVGQSHYVRELAPQAKTPGKGLISNESPTQGGLGIKKGLVDRTKPYSKPLAKYRKPSSFVACSNTFDRPET